MTSSITPILLAGGSGTRLWPLSRKSYPKQFAKIVGDKSLFQQSILRFNSSDRVSFTEHVTLTNTDFRFIVCEEFLSAGVDPGSILIEPESKNTAPAVLAACLFVMRNDPEAILLVAPSDHVIHEIGEFHDALSKGLTEVECGNIVTFGVLPTRAETGYGYLELADAYNEAPVRLKSFVEKPDKLIAQEMLDKGNFLWNSGIIMFRAKDMVALFENLAPDNLSFVKEALSKGRVDLGFFRLDAEAWSKCDSISIDYAIMENAENLVTVPFSAGWSDLGDWDAVNRELNNNVNDLALSVNAHAIDCRNTALRSESPGQEIVGLGLDNIFAVSMPDAVLICHKNQVQNVSKVVTLLKGKKIPQAESFLKDHRPWGWFETVALGNRFQVKRIVVNPGAQLSLQSHHHRSEHWVVVEGTAKVSIDKKEHLLTEGESIYIPLGALHRMENPGKVPLAIIEIQTGAYLGEDDIKRYEDIYARE